ncbi:hypothetical protein U9M48_014456 [Paspalum notatum var. saurae]|uniref:Uncharacterized protein n=1 Tax=Paspalum notatum var. saurae TaxID=547442 RepID=A0AAQ3T1L2_PASNO
MNLPVPGEALGDSSFCNKPLLGGARRGERNIIRASKRAEVEAIPVTRKSPEKLLKFRLLELAMVPSF